jgi:hypothetical protein
MVAAASMLPVTAMGPFTVLFALRQSLSGL